MRKPVMAGNWKMNKTRDEALDFIYSVAGNVPSVDKVDTIVCAPAIILRDLVKRKGDNLEIGAQNMHEKDSGAYTGEISPAMLTSTGVKYVILGHSERRQYFNETDSSINLKIKAALNHGLKPIVCCGETLEVRQAGNTNDCLKDQIIKAFEGVEISNPQDIIIAYEPIWAIGTGVSASKEDANSGCAHIRTVIEGLYGANVANELRILYGGSVSTATADDLIHQSDIDGFLVGKVSLSVEGFVELSNIIANK